MGFAAPAYQGEIEFKQSNGSSFTGHLNGDEYFSWIEDKQGHIIKYNNHSKNYELAVLKEQNGTVDLVPSGVKVPLKTAGIFAPSLAAEQSKIDKDTLSKIWKRKRKEVPYHH